MPSILKHIGAAQWWEGEGNSGGATCQSLTLEPLGSIDQVNDTESKLVNQQPLHPMAVVRYFVELLQLR